MLNGTSPVLVYTYTPIDTSFTLFGFNVPSIGIPIPIYLDERLTGIMGEGASSQITVETATINNQTYQKQIGNEVTIKLRCRNNNLVGQTLIAILGEAFKHIPEGDYHISVFYDSIFMIGALLKSFYSRPIENTDLREIGITLSKKYQQTFAPIEVSKVANAIPLGV